MSGQPIRSQWQKFQVFTLQSGDCVHLVSILAGFSIGNHGSSMAGKTNRHGLDVSVFGTPRGQAMTSAHYPNIGGRS